MTLIIHPIPQVLPLKCITYPVCVLRPVVKREKQKTKNSEIGDTKRLRDKSKPL